MQVFSVIAIVLCLAIGANATAVFSGMVPSNQLTLTSSNKNTATGWGVTVISSSPTYRGDANGNALNVVVNATWVGGATALPTDSFIYPDAYITFSQAQENFITTGCTPSAAQSQDSFGSGVRDNTGNFLQYTGNFYPYMKTAATGVQATVHLEFPPGTTVASATFNFDIVAPVYTRPTSGITPTIGSISVLSSRNNVNYAGANVSIATAAPGDYLVQLVYLATTGNQGVAWSHGCLITVANGATTGSCQDSDFGRLNAYIGSWCGDYFAGSSASTIAWTGGLTVALRSVTITAQDQDGFTSAFPAPGGVSSMTIAGTATDVTAPTCTGALFTAPLDVSTGTTSTSNVVTIGCSDEASGSGLFVVGAFARASASGLQFDYSVGGSSATLTPSALVPAHYDGTVSLIGVWAMDADGNAAVYGQCIAGSPQTICGGSGGASSSSAVVASISLVIALILAVLAL